MKLEEVMPETDQIRISQDAKTRIAELERVVKALVTAVQNQESNSGDPIMPVGEYYGVKFDAD